MACQRVEFDILDHDRPSPLSWGHSSSLSIAIVRQGEIPGERWASFERSFGQIPTGRMLLFVLGSVDLAPPHRRSLTRAIAERNVAAIVDSMVGRGMITSLSWSGVTVENFPISRIREALAALDPESEGESIEECLDFAARLIDGAELSTQLRAKLVDSTKCRPAVLR